MRRTALAAIVALPSLALAGAATAQDARAQSAFAPEAAALLQEGLIVTADSFILPGYVRQADAAASLVASLDTFCRGAGEIAPVHAAFAEIFLAWQRISIIHVGPVTAAEGPMRVQLWPDPKGFAQRAVRAAAQAEDPALLEPGALEGRSVALMNLTALEHLLYEDLQPGAYGCDLAMAIARFQADLAEGLVTSWVPGGEYRALYDTARDGNALYGSVDALLRELLAGAVVYSDRLRKFKIQRGLGTAPGDARAERTEATRSGLGLQSIAVSFRALSDLYETPFGIFDAGPEIGGSMEYFMLGEVAANVADALSLETASLAEIAQEDGARAEALRGYGELVLYHESFLKTDFLNSIGLTAGFTAADGD